MYTAPTLRSVCSLFDFLHESAGGVQRHRRCLSLPRRARETPSSVGQIKKVQLFLKNPLDKWAPRAIMQPTSEELQTYDGEK